MTSLDTNVVLRLLLGDVPAQAAKVAELLRENKCYLTDAVAVEVVYVLEKVYKHPRPDITALLRKLLAIDNLQCSEFALIEALDLYLKRPSLSIIDCYAVVEAGTTANHLATFDAKLLKHGGDHVVIV
ncbi:MAG: PIN domain-containing protein [Acidobacteria bacterium]|nr:PIN domain-containing protein [Acidobacteriota bacterium]